MNVLNAYLIPTREEVRQAGNYLLGKLPTKEEVQVKLPGVGRLYSRLHNQQKVYKYVDELVRDLNEQVSELRGERNHYRDSADRLLEKLNNTIEELDFAHLMAGDLVRDKAGRRHNKGIDRSDSPPVGHDGLDEFDIKKRSSLVNGSSGVMNIVKDMPELELLMGSAGESPWPMSMRPPTEDLRAILQNGEINVDNVSDMSLATEYDKARSSEAGRIKAMLGTNHALNIKATNNEYRVMAEIQGRVPETRTGDLAVKNTLRYSDGINGENNFDGRTMKSLPSNVKELVVDFFDYNRMRMRLFDHEGNLLNPSVEDSVEENNVS